MTRRLLLLIGAVCVLGLATPSQATFWKSGFNHDQGKDWNFQWPSHDDLPECDWDWDWDWGDQSWPTHETHDGGDWWNKDNHDWGDWGDWGNWGDEHEWDWKDHEWHCHPKDRPVPEPATAGLAFMGLAALGFAVRRRK